MKRIPSSDRWTATLDAGDGTNSNNGTANNSLNPSLRQNGQVDLPLLSCVSPPNYSLPQCYSNQALSLSQNSNHTPKLHSLTAGAANWSNNRDAVESRNNSDSSDEQVRQRPSPRQQQQQLPSLHLAPLPSPVRQASSYKDDMNNSSVEANKLKPNISVSPSAGKPATFRGVQAARQLQPSKQSTPLPKFSGYNDSLAGSMNCRVSPIGGFNRSFDTVDGSSPPEKPRRRYSQHVAAVDYTGGAYSMRSCEGSEASGSPRGFELELYKEEYGNPRSGENMNTVPLSQFRFRSNTDDNPPHAEQLAELTPNMLHKFSTSDDQSATQTSSDTDSGNGGNDRGALFHQLLTVAALLERQREHQRQTKSSAQAKTSELTSPLFSMTSLNQLEQEEPEFYYTDLSAKEKEALNKFLYEATEVKARVESRYGIDTVQGSWALLLKSPNLNEFGQDLYNALVTERVLIPTQFVQLSVEERAQALLKVLDTTINMYNKPREMVDFLIKTGADHQRFGVGEQEFFVLRNAVLRLLPQYAPAEVVEASAKDWSRFWGFTINLMTQGGRTPEGNVNRKLYEGDYAKQIQTVIKGIKANQDKLPLEKHFVNVMFDKSREICPHLEKFRTLFNNRRSCDRFYDSVVMIADLIGRQEDIAIYMQELGGRHVAYGITRKTLEEFEEPFMLALRALAGEEVWNITIEHNLLLFYRSMVDGISAGMNNGKDTTANRWAPDGSEPFCLLFTDVESSTDLWQRYPTVMREAIDKHHRIIRTVIADFGGYEVKTAGDSFIIAVKDVLAGLKIAVAIQLELMRQVPIAEGFEMLDDVQGHGDPEAWNKQTLRVRIGIQHCTEATATYDSIHRRYDYYGTSVNQCARIEAAAAGGQILMSRETFKALKAIPAFHDEPCPAFLRDIEGNSPIDARGFDHFVAMCDVGKVKLKGIKRPVHLASVVPMCLAGRDFSELMHSRTNSTF